MKLLTTATLVATLAYNTIALAEVLSVENVTNDYQLFVTVWEGAIEIRPNNDGVVSVDYRCERDTEGDAAAVESGLRVVSRESRLPELRRSDDKITFTAQEEAGRCRVAVSAPPSLGSRVRINDTGEIVVRDWLGSMTAWSAGGDVTLVSQQGAFSVTAMNGDANVEFVSTSLAADSAITAANGLVALSFLSEPAVTLRAQARWGAVLTDLDASFARETDEQSTWSVAQVGGGGPIVTLRNLNSDIKITRAASAN